MMSERAAPGLSYVWVTQVRRTRQVDKQTAIREPADGHFISERRIVRASVQDWNRKKASIGFDVTDFAPSILKCFHGKHQKGKAGGIDLLIKLA